MCIESNMTRAYTLKRRAQKQAETRRRIVEAAVELHGSVGPTLTTISMVAERAGVQRHTFYAHFPDERSLFMACSGLVFERDPLPDPEPWRAIENREKRLRAGLREIYAWYSRNADLVACVLRDGEVHALTREISELRTAPSMKAFREILGSDLTKAQLAILELALSFFTWRTLVRDKRAGQDAAVVLMVRAIACAEGAEGRARPIARTRP